MSYNLLFNTQFKKLDRWKFVNCSFENGYLISTGRIFGIKQELTLSDLTKLYGRVTYNILDSKIDDVYVGISNKGILSVTTHKTPKPNKEQIISVVEDNKETQIEFYIIFQSQEEINKVKIKEPLLIDLNRLKRPHWIKSILDKLIKYRIGFSYTNLLSYSELKPEITNGEKAKIGSIISTLDKIEIKIPAKLYARKQYLIKLDYTPINDIGKVYIQYGVLKSIKIENNQLYLSFKGGISQELKIVIEPNNVLPYQVNLKHLLLIESGTGGYVNQDIPYLPYIGD